MIDGTYHQKIIRIWASDSGRTSTCLLHWYKISRTGKTVYVHWMMYMRCTFEQKSSRTLRIKHFIRMYSS